MQTRVASFIMAALPSIVLLLALTGCSGSDTTGAGPTRVTTVEVPVAGPTVYLPSPSSSAPAAEPRAKIVITFPAAQSARAAAAQVRFVGYDGGDTIHYGPLTFPAAPEITLDDVPITVVGLVIESVGPSGAVSESRHAPTQLREGDTVHIDDPDRTAALLEGLAVVPGRGSIAVGTSMAFHLQGVFSSGITQDLTRTATWSCADSQVARLRGTQSGLVGLVEGLAAGETDVVATYAQRQGKGRLVVRDTTVTRLDVTPPTASLGIDTAVPLTAVARLADGTVQDVTHDAAWTSSAPRVARVLNAPPNSGLVVGIGGGDARIQASFGGRSASADVRVSGAELTAIRVVPGVAMLASGLTQPLSALATYADGATADVTSQVSWSTSDSTVAAVTSGGSSSGLVHGLSPGSAVITARLGGTSGTAALTVTEAQVVRLTVTAPATAIVLGDTLQLTATALFTDGANQDVSSQALWRSENGAVLRMVGATATAATSGATTVTASFRGATASLSVLVVQGQVNQMTISSPRWWMGVGETLSLISSVLLPDGTVQALTSETSWTSANPDMATVTSPGGVVTGVSLGQATITATHGTHGSVSAPLRIIGNGELVSRTSSGEPAVGFSQAGAITADGRFATFSSTAYGVVPGGFNGLSDFYVRDRLLQTTERVTVSTSGDPADERSFGLAVSADGGVMAFYSYATNLGPGPVFVRNRALGTTTSIGSAGGDPNWLSVSDDGRYVHLAGMRYDLQEGSHVSTPDRSGSRLSGSGRYVVYQDGAPRQIYVVDVDAGTPAELVSITPFGTAGNGQSRAPSISTDGRFVVFQSNASDLVTGDTNGYADVFVRDRLLGVTERVSVSTDDEQADRNSYADATDAVGWASADGRYVIFSSLATNLDPHDTSPQFVDVFVRDRVAGTTRCLTPSFMDASNPCVRFSSGDIFAKSASADGSFATFGAYGWWSITYGESFYQHAFVVRTH